MMQPGEPVFNKMMTKNSYQGFLCRIAILFVLFFSTTRVFSQYTTNKTQLRKLFESSKLDSDVKQLLKAHSVYLSNDTFSRILLDDSLVIQVLSAAQPDTGIKCLFRLGFLELDMGNFANTKAIFRQATALSKEYNYQSGITLTTFYDALVTFESGDTTVAEKLFMKCLSDLDASGEILDLYSPLSAMRIFFNV